MLKPLPAWKASIAAIPPSKGPVWANNFANWYATEIATIFPKPPTLVPTGFVFTFNTAVFITMLSKNPPTLDPVAGINGFANAWEAALLASVVVVSPGTYYGSPGPATTFSVVIASIIDVPSIALGKLHLLNLVAAPPAAGGADSKFPQIFREATLMLTMTVTGINSSAPTTSPLVAPLCPLE